MKSFILLTLSLFLLGMLRSEETFRLPKMELTTVQYDVGEAYAPPKKALIVEMKPGARTGEMRYAFNGTRVNTLEALKEKLSEHRKQGNKGWPVYVVIDQSCMASEVGKVLHALTSVGMWLVKFVMQSGKDNDVKISAIEVMLPACNSYPNPKKNGDVTTLIFRKDAKRKPEIYLNQALIPSKKLSGKLAELAEADTKAMIAFRIKADLPFRYVLRVANLCRKHNLARLTLPVKASPVVMPGVIHDPADPDLFFTID